MSQQTVAGLSLADMDRAHVLHPFTSVAEHQDSGPHFIDRAKGTQVYDRAGKEYLDTMAGLWCVNVGYGHPRMVEAIRKQTEKLSFYHSFMGAGNEPAARFAEAIAQRAPAGLNGSVESRTTSCGVNFISESTRRKSWSVPLTCSTILFLLSGTLTPCVA